MPKLVARRQLNAITAATFVHWAGDSKDPKTAARAGRRMRKKYLRELHRLAAGRGRYDDAAGVDVLRTADQLEGWFRAHQDVLGPTG